MKVETILKMPDGKEKFWKLEMKMLQIPPHGLLYEEVKKEWRRLYDIYGKGCKK